MAAIPESPGYHRVRRTPITSSEYVPWAAAALVLAVALRSIKLRDLVMHGVNGMGWLPLIDLFHATAVAHEYRDTAEPQPPLQRLVAITVTALGGTTMMNLLLGAPMGWLSDHFTLGAYILMWALMHHMPGDLLYRALKSSAALRFVMGVLDDISWGVAITKCA